MDRNGSPQILKVKIVNEEKSEETTQIHRKYEKIG